MGKYGYLVVIAMLFVFAACSDPSTSTQSTTYTGIMPASELAQYQSCTADDDCTYVNNGCCDCANGGEETAINQSNVAAYEARFSCSSVNCTQVAREPSCGAVLSGLARCVDGQCAFVPSSD